MDQVLQLVRSEGLETQRFLPPSDMRTRGMHGLHRKDLRFGLSPPSFQQQEQQEQRVWELRRAVCRVQYFSQ